MYEFHDVRTHSMRILFSGDEGTKGQISNFHALMSLYAIYSNIGGR